jgi:hypothetical protein
MRAIVKDDAKKRKEVKKEKKRREPYSERNNKVKEKLPYSVLKPDTNSLSPSAKSNGIR